MIKEDGEGGILKTALLLLLLLLLLQQDSVNICLNQLPMTPFNALTLISLNRETFVYVP